MADWDCAVPPGVGVVNNDSVPVPNDKHFDTGMPVGVGIPSARVSVPAHYDHHWDATYKSTVGTGNAQSTFQPTEFFYDCYYEKQLGGIVQPYEKIRDIPLLTRILP